MLDESVITSLFPDEVVTRALVRDVALPYGAGTMALITLDNGHDHTRPNTFGPRGLLALRDALDSVASRITPEAGERRIAAVGVTGKPFIFAAGADLGVAAMIRARDEALAVGRLGHEVFRRFGELGVPSFAFVNGAALGGGLELALHCSYRTISSGITAIAFPECLLGLLPGWGGTYLLPRLIGPSRALKVIIENPLSQNRMLTGPQAFSLGIADVMLEPADFLAESLRWAARVLTGSEAVSRVVPEENLDQAVASARLFADGKLHGAAPAPYRAIDLVAAARGRSRDEGFAAEDEGLADLLLSDEMQAGLYAFDLTQKRARRAAGAPDASVARPVTKVGVVGAGLMAAQIALLFARRLEVPVVLTDVDRTRLDSGLGHVRAEIAALADRGRIGADAAARLTGLVTGSLSKDAFADADFVIEAVFEDMAVKQKVFAEVEAVVRPDCVLATNTSSLSVTEMANDLSHPERVVGFHFFNPVAMMPLVEVIRAAETDDVTLATALAVGRTLKKSCVLVKDSPAFVVNRLLTRFLGEVTACVDEGTAFEVAEHATDSLGLPMPPFLLLQLVGPAVALHVTQTLAAAYPDRFTVSPKLQALVDAGVTAVYRPDFTVDPAVAALLARGGMVAGGDRPSTAEQVRERALEALAEEIRLMLDEAVVSGPEDIDLCMILGAGWPFHLGGITPYLDRSGITEKVTGTRFRI
ncbi:MAG TPA: 3-hydroxyacyl-CoA dehydrogenase NAD-binding domain-containing protein [Streptosporangiaceae bacterium]|jgi:3-hydroxyacyl-CoA dehydrogenase/enoyl-CoA hydratase/carnithine racemase|nr:3-hydroxyacyl-CoA dehydrogenase NAD-binding domain-containing protein [Streptosporangiaceae bacterium]